MEHALRINGVTPPERPALRLVPAEGPLGQLVAAIRDSLGVRRVTLFRRDASAEVMVEVACAVDAGRRGLGGGLTLPLVAEGGRLLGALEVVDVAGRVLDDRKVPLLRVFADHAALLLDLLAQVDAAQTRERAAAERCDVLQDALEHLSQGVGVLDGRRCLVTWNDRLLDLLALEPGQVRVGTPLGATMGRLAGRGPAGEAAGAPPSEWLAALDRGEAFGVEWTRPDGRVIEVRGTPASGEAFVVTCGDVTEQRRSADVLRQSEAHLRQAQKMEAVGRLAGGVAHDFNNLLTVIAGRSELLLRVLEAGEPTRRHAELIQQTAFRAADLTRQLLAFSRKQVLRPEVLDLGAVVEKTEAILRRLIGEHIELRSVREPHLWRVRADPGQVEQVIVNLAVNARDAMPGGGILALETANVELDEAFVRAHVGARPGPHVLLAVTDTGVGMDAETRAHVFEPFFTTKGPGKGTGLGLATVYGIVKQSDGYVWVESEPGRGTRFEVYLPRVDAPPDAPGEVPPARGLPGGRETVLLVEDQAEVRDFAREILQMAGYAVLEARDGRDALHVAERHGESIHLLLTDVVMPHIGGRELASRLAPLRPAMRVLYMSGYTDDAIVRQGAVGPGAAFLPKPFTADALARRVRATLDG